MRCFTISLRFAWILLAIVAVFGAFNILSFIWTIFSVVTDDLSLLTLPNTWSEGISHAESADTIPRIIHQLYKTDNLSSMPAHWQTASRSCRELHPEYEHKLWTDESMMEFIRTRYPESMQEFSKYSHAIQRIDAVRYFLMYEYGGFYLDMDVGCLMSLEPLRTINAVILPHTQPYGVSNDMMASPARHPFLRYALSQLWPNQRNLLVKTPTVLFSTGPMFVDTALQSYNQRMKYLYGTLDKVPQHASVKILPDLYYNGSSGTSFFYHVNGNSWHESDSHFIGWYWKNISTFLPLTILSLLTFCVLLCIGCRQCKSKKTHVGKV